MRFFYFAKGSLAELRTQIQIAFEIGYIDGDVFRKVDNECSQIGRMTGALINARNERKNL